MASHRTAPRFGAMSVRSPTRPATRGRAAETQTEPGGYVTDSTRLFRCLETH